MSRDGELRSYDDLRPDQQAMLDRFTGDGGLRLRALNEVKYMLPSGMDSLLRHEIVDRVVAVAEDYLRRNP